MPQLEEIADELLVLPPATFTAARNARAKELGGELGAAVKALPKPSVGAWATNLLARAKAEEIGQLFDLGDALREAQEGADRETLAMLGSQRRALVAALARQAASLAEDAGHPITAAAIDDVERTLQAGMTDAAAAAAVASGRLVRALAGDGLDAVDLNDAVGGSLPTARATVARPAKKKPAPSRKAIDAADSAIRAARGRAEEAERMSREAGRVKGSLTAERADLREQLARVEDDLTAATREVEAAERERVGAARAVEDAERSREALGA